MKERDRERDRERKKKRKRRIIKSLATDGVKAVIPQ